MNARTLAIVGGSVGNLIEWYDLYIYSFFSLYFAKAFVPGSSPTAQLSTTAGIFALGFLMRPVGGYVMGRYADRHGRRAALTLAVLMMSGGSLMVGLCPTSATIGKAAPALLLAARLVQGLSLGGEYGASATYLSEVSSPRHRGFQTSFQYVTLIGGQLIASVMLFLLQHALTAAQLEAWAWRIPFLIGAALALAAFWLRRNIIETEDFTRLVAVPQDHRPQPLRALWGQRREVAIVLGLTMGGTLAFYVYTTYMPKFLVNSTGLSRETATLVSMLTLFLFACMQPLLGALSDRIGRRPLMIGFGVCGVLFTVPILSALRATHDPVTAFLLVLAGLAIVSGYTSINAVVKAELFPAGIRALGVALPYAIAVSVFGGSAEYVALWFKSAGHESWFFWYVTALIGGSLLVYVSMRETRRTSLIGRG